MIVALLLALLILVSATAWKAYQITRAPWDQSLRWVTAALVFYTLGLLAQGGVRAAEIGAASGSAVLHLVQDVPVLGALYCTYMFFCIAWGGRTITRYRVLAELAVALVTQGLLVLAVTQFPPDLRGYDFTPQNIQVTPVLGYYIALGAYTCYAYGRSVVLAGRHLRAAGWHLRIGLHTARVGMVTIILATVVRLVGAVGTWAGAALVAVSQVGSTLIGLGLLLFYIGVSYPGVRIRLSAVRLWMRRRQRYGQLRPLRDLMAGEFTEIRQGRDARYRLVERFGPRLVHTRFHARMLEIRDGLSLLSPYVDGAIGDADPPARAAMLLDAIELQARSAERLEPRLVMPPRRDTLDDDADQLALVSQCLRRLLRDRPGPVPRTA